MWNRIAQTLSELIKYKEMIFSMVRRELRGRYKGSFLGFLWTFLNPLLQLVVYSLVFTTIMRVPDVEIYYLYLFIGLIPWIFFSTSITSGCRCIIDQKDLVCKIYFPREILPIVNVTSGFINMLLCFIIVFLAVFINGIRLDPMGLLILPLIFIIEYVLALGLTLLTSALTVYFRDLEHILGIITMAWMYLTPTFYTPEMIPEEFKALYNLNPMAHIVTAYRDILYYGSKPELSTLIGAVVLGIFFLSVGSAAFSRLKKHFAEEL